MNYIFFIINIFHRLKGEKCKYDIYNDKGILNFTIDNNENYITNINWEKYNNKFYKINEYIMNQYMNLIISINYLHDVHEELEKIKKSNPINYMREIHDTIEYLYDYYNIDIYYLLKNEPKIYYEKAYYESTIIDSEFEINYIIKNIENIILKITNELYCIEDLINSGTINNIYSYTRKIKKYPKTPYLKTYPKNYQAIVHIK